MVVSCMIIPSFPHFFNNYLIHTVMLPLLYLRTFPYSGQECFNSLMPGMPVAIQTLVFLYRRTSTYLVFATNIEVMLTP